MTVACHCRDCQKMSGGAFSITMFVKSDTFELLRGELMVFERDADKGSKALCYFCPLCSNRIYHVNPDAPEFFRLKSGVLDDTSQIIPQVHCWTSRAQPWLKFTDDLPKHESQPDDLGSYLREIMGKTDAIING